MVNFHLPPRHALEDMLPLPVRIVSLLPGWNLALRYSMKSSCKNLSLHGGKGGSRFWSKDYDYVRPMWNKLTVLYGGLLQIIQYFPFQFLQNKYSQSDWKMESILHIKNHIIQKKKRVHAARRISVLGVHEDSSIRSSIWAVQGANKVTQSLLLQLAGLNCWTGALLCRATLMPRIGISHLHHLAKAKRMFEFFPCWPCIVKQYPFQQKSDWCVFLFAVFPKRKGKAMAAS